MSAASIQRVLTIGVYGFTAEEFFGTLQAAGTDLFCDIRARRGLRGSEYAFANSQRLQGRLTELSIPYVHLKQLAPSQAVRDAQYKHDQDLGIAKRSREELGEVFKTKYADECLAHIDPIAFCHEHLANASRPVFFCVERSFRACHRALVAETLAAALNVPIDHLEP